MRVMTVVVLIFRFKIFISWCKNIRYFFLNIGGKLFSIKIPLLKRFNTKLMIKDALFTT